MCHTADHAQIQRLDSEKTSETHRRATHSDEVVRMKRIPLPNYSLSIAVQENALRVTWLMRVTFGSAAADPRLLAAAPGH